MIVGCPNQSVMLSSANPFMEENEVDGESHRVCVGFWTENEVSGPAPYGRSSEATLVTRAEERQVIETVIDETDRRAPVVAGTKNPTYPTLAVGRRGAIVAIANAAPGDCSVVYISVLEGRHSEASETPFGMFPLNTVLTKKYSLVACRTALQLLGRPTSKLKKPLLDLEEKAKQDGRGVLQGLSLIGS